MNPNAQVRLLNRNQKKTPKLSFQLLQFLNLNNSKNNHFNNPSKQ
jgi:hypothetical protein